MNTVSKHFLPALNKCVVVVINLEVESETGDITLHCTSANMLETDSEAGMKPINCDCAQDCRAIKIELDKKENAMNKKNLDDRERALEVCTE